MKHAASRVAMYTCPFSSALSPGWLTPPAKPAYEEARIRLAVHGDDVVREGRESGLQRLACELKKAFEVKVEILCTASHLCKALTPLNRVVELKEDGVTWEPDPRHCELITRSLGLEGSKRAVTPGLREHGEKRAALQIAYCHDEEEATEVRSVDKKGVVRVKAGDEVNANDNRRARLVGLNCC